MSKLIQLGWCLTLFSLSGCTLTPEQQAARETKRIQAQQLQQIKLAKQCDVDTARVMEEYFYSKKALDAQSQIEFEKRYLEKVNHPIFQACYKLALENEKAQRALDEMRYEYWDRPYRYAFPRFCYSCW